MKEVRITDVEAHEPFLGLFSMKVKHPVMKNGEDMRRLLTVFETKTMLSCERTGETNATLFENYTYSYLPTTREHVFTKKEVTPIIN